MAQRPSSAVCLRLKRSEDTEVLGQVLVLGVIAFHRDSGRLDMERPRDFSGATQQLEPLVPFHRSAVQVVQAEQEDAVIDDVRLSHHQDACVPAGSVALRSSARITSAKMTYAKSAVVAAALSDGGGGPKKTAAWIASMITPNTSIAVRRAVPSRK